MLMPFVGVGIVRSLGLCMRTNNYRIKFNVRSMKVVVFTVGGDIISIAHREAAVSFIQLIFRHRSVRIFAGMFNQLFFTAFERFVSRVIISIKIGFSCFLQ